MATALAATGCLAVSSTVAWSLAVVAAISLPFLAALTFHPITRRLAVRYPFRRPTEAALVVLGSLLGTAIITGSLIVGDTIDRSIRSMAYDQLGPIDEVVSVPGLDEGAELSARITSVADVAGAGDTLDGVLPIVTTQVAVIGERVQPRAQLLEVDFEAARAFGDDPAITGMVGATPAPGTAAITTDLAIKTGAGAGDTITVFVYGVAVEVVVDRVLEQTGVAGFWPIDERQQSYNVFVAPGSLRAGLAGATLPPEVEPPQTVLAFSNRGGVEDAVARTDGAVALIAAAVGGDAAVRTVKRDVLEEAEIAAESLTQLYFTMGMFAVAAGILLLVNIFVMLADERRSQLGMMRALGMRRGSVVMAFATEGWLYALVSSAIGALIGIQIGRVIAFRADQILTSGEDVYSLHLTFAYDAETVLQGFAIGLAIAVVTIVLTSVRISRLNVIAAIRDLPVIRRGSRRRWLPLAGLLAVAVGVTWTVGAVQAGNEYGIALGPMLAACGVAMWVVRRTGVRATTTVLAIAVLAWGTLFVPVLGWLDIDAGIPIFLAQGTTMCAAAVGLLMVHHKALGAWLSERFGGALPVRIGLAYPVAKAFRTALTLGMFGIVILTIVYISFISLMFRRQTDDITADLSGGFGVVVTSNPSSPVTTDELLTVDGVTGVAPLAYGLARIQFDDRSDDWPLTGFGPELASEPPTLADRGEYETDEDAWSAVVADPGLVIVDEFLLAEAGPVERAPRPGDLVTLTDPVSGNARTAAVAAIATADFLVNGAFYGVDGYRALFGERTVESRFYVAAPDAEAAALAIGTTYAPNGAEAVVIRESVDALLAQNTGFFTLMQQFVGIGLLVGIAGLGVVMLRSVRERRRDVGVLRAIGMEPRPVTGSFMLEALFIAAEGVVIGVVVAMVGTYGLVLDGTGFAEGFRWAVPWRDVMGIAALTIAAALITAVIPSTQAGRTRPARALRVVD